MRVKLFIISILAIFAPIRAAIITVGVLVFIDLITGIWAAKKRKEPITSKGLRRTISKLVVFEAAILLAFLTEKYLTSELVPMCKIATAFIGLIEYTSVLENLNEINGKPIFKKLIDLISKKEDDLI